MSTTRRSFFVPEVVQTSAMDCGPAALKCLLEGFGVHASYGRLREACQTDVDGTSIDTIEEAARQLGLDAEQIMLSSDHLLLPAARALPAIVVVRLSNGATHFLVVWRRIGPFLQLMDPSTGRRWTTCKAFLDELFIHTQRVPAEAWRSWAGTDSFLAPLRKRLARIGVRSSDIVNRALAPGWRPIAALDAATRMTTLLVNSGAVRRGAPAERMIHSLIDRQEMIPADYWSVRSANEDELDLRGAVLVNVKGLLPEAQRLERPASPELAAALDEAPTRPGRELLRMLAGDGVIAPLAIMAAFVLAAAGVMVEAVLFQGLLNLRPELGLYGQRLGAVAALIAFLVLLLLLELPLVSSLLRYGRRLEIRLRTKFLEKIPVLGDRYFQSRLMSDMTERNHSIYRIRHLPELGGHFLRGFFELILTALGIVWLDPASLPLAALAAGLAIVIPLLFQPPIIESDLRVRTHAGALSRYYLDALLGLVPIRIHGAERAIRREHAGLLAEWARAGLDKQRTIVWAEAIHFTVGFGLAALLLVNHLSRNTEAAGVLLLVYWALNLPVIGQEVALAAWQYPANRNLTLRQLEPLGAPEERMAPPVEGAIPLQQQSGMAVDLSGVMVRLSGHVILEDINLSIEPGSHVAIVGPSGAGKSSLVGLLMGWHRAAEGTVRMDDAPIEGHLEEIRRQTAWVDPAVQLWNKSFLENIGYGNSIAGSGGASAIGSVVEAADLIKVLEKLPEGFETSLGEGGALVSGGEGQRVRLARAMLRSGVRLVVLDEPFRGLDLQQRGRLLARSRKLWAGATLLCITHDVGETKDFDRVIVIESGRILEDGKPGDLLRNPASRYSALLDAGQEVGQGFWSGDVWRRLRLEGGAIH